jgi:hypothetical protein
MSQHQTPAQPYTTYPPEGQLPNAFPPPPFVPPVVPPKRGRNMTAVIVIVVLVLVIVASTIGFVGYNNNQKTLHANATSTAQANATANVLGTVSAQNTVYAHQTAVASTYPFSANQVFNDPLTDNSKGYAWDNDNQFCYFSGSTYHVYDDQVKTYQACVASKTNFSDFTYEVQMVIKKGDPVVGGGLIFRSDSANNKFYRLYIDTTGNYGILVSVDKTGTNTRTLKSGAAASFTNGIGATNTIAVVAKGDQISLYVNRELVTTVTDSTYSKGQIGFDTDLYTSQTGEVVFNNAKVWAL